MFVLKQRSKERNWYRRSRSVSRGNQLLVQSKAKAKQGRTSLNRPTQIPLSGWQVATLLLSPFETQVCHPDQTVQRIYCAALLVFCIPAN